MRTFARFLLLTVACAPPRIDGAVEPGPVAARPPVNREPPVAEAPPAREGPQVTYVANEGVLLTFADRAVLIDGLHRPYKPDYAVLDEEHRRIVEHAEGAFAAVRLILVSHVHRDHFDAGAVRAHLEHNPRARLVGSPQVVDAVRAVLPDPALRERVEVVAYAPGVREVREHDRITVEFLGLPHGSARFRDVHNFGHVIEIGGQKFLHVGDTELDEPALAAFDLPARGLDAAFLPYWYFLQPERLAVIERRIGARRYYAVHISPGDAEALATLARVAPAVTPLVDLLTSPP
jgi:L-ascorbate metabolism protein UlaG (beta-lactamase superfamily)